MAEIAGRAKLLVVSKTFPAPAIEPLLEAGQRLFGENRVQEAMEKWPRLKAKYPDIELHLIGPLQTNKVKEAIGLFNVIQTLDRPQLLEALVKAGKTHPLPKFFIQVNTGREPQKAGVAPEDLPELLGLCQTHRLEPKGLMCIPPFDQDPEPHFALLAAQAKLYQLPELSMGMSHDFLQAIAQGATIVRVGSAIFGER